MPLDGGRNLGVFPHLEALALLGCVQEPLTLLKSWPLKKPLVPKTLNSVVEAWPLHDEEEELDSKPETEDDQEDDHEDEEI